MHPVAPSCRIRGKAQNTRQPRESARESATNCKRPQCPGFSFGTKGSQVQILSPRQSKYRKARGILRSPGPSLFRTPLGCSDSAVIRRANPAPDDRARGDAAKSPEPRRGDPALAAERSAHTATAASHGCSFAQSPGVVSRSVAQTHKCQVEGLDPFLTPFPGDGRRRSQGHHGGCDGEGRQQAHCGDAGPKVAEGAGREVVNLGRLPRASEHKLGGPSCLCGRLSVRTVSLRGARGGDDEWTCTSRA